MPVQDCWEGHFSMEFLQGIGACAGLLGRTLLDGVLTRHWCLCRIAGKDTSRWSSYKALVPVQDCWEGHFSMEFLQGNQYMLISPHFVW